MVYLTHYTEYPIYEPAEGVIIMLEMKQMNTIA